MNDIVDITPNNYPKCAKLFEQDNNKHWLFISSSEIRNDPNQLVDLILKDCIYDDPNELSKRIKEKSSKKINKNTKFYQLHLNIFICVGEKFNNKEFENFIQNKKDIYKNKIFVELETYLSTNRARLIDFILSLNKNKYFKNCYNLYLIYSHLQLILNSKFIIINNFKTFKIINLMSDIINSCLFAYNLKRENKKFFIPIIISGFSLILSILLPIISRFVWN